MNATLVSIRNSIENFNLFHRPPISTPNYGNYGNGVFWTGMNSLAKRGVYKWSDNTPVTFTNWASTTSNGDPINPDYHYQGRLWGN